MKYLWAIATVTCAIFTVDALQASDALWSLLTVNTFAIAFLASIVATVLLVNPYGFAAVLRHELTHSLAALATFNRPVALQVNVDGSGSAEYRGRANWLIYLAPYFLPLVSLPLLIAGVCGFASGTAYTILLAIAAGFDLAVAWRQFGYHQLDLQYAGGKVVSTILVVSTGIVMWSFILIYGVTGSRSAVVELAIVAWNRALLAGATVVDWSYGGLACLIQ